MVCNIYFRNNRIIRNGQKKKKKEKSKIENVTRRMSWMLLQAEGRAVSEWNMWAVNGDILGRGECESM